MTETIEMDEAALDESLEELESAMNAAKRAHSHDEIRPSTVEMGKRIKDAYGEIVKAHPKYELNEGNDD